MNCSSHQFTDGASLLSSLLSTGGTKVCVHEADLTCDGLSQYGKSCWVVTLKNIEFKFSAV